jgi:hypothetical protein
METSCESHPVLETRPIAPPILRAAAQQAPGGRICAARYV